MLTRLSNVCSWIEAFFLCEIDTNGTHFLFYRFGVCHSRFLKAKVTILQQELDLSHQENVKHLDKIAKSAEQYKKLEAGRCQASNTINSLNSQIKKHQQNDANAALKLKVCKRRLLKEKIPFPSILYHSWFLWNNYDCINLSFSFIVLPFNAAKNTHTHKHRKMKQYKAASARNAMS